MGDMVCVKAAILVLYLPWLGVRCNVLPEWKSPAPAYQFGPALLDTFRWFVFGRTISTAQVTSALGIAGLFVLVSILLSRNTRTRNTLHALRFTLYGLPFRLVARSRRPHLCRWTLQRSLSEVSARVQPGVLPAVRAAS